MARIINQKFYSTEAVFLVVCDSSVSNLDRSSLCSARSQRDRTRLKIRPQATVITTVNYDPNMFIVQATDGQSHKTGLHTFFLPEYSMMLYQGQKQQHSGIAHNSSSQGGGFKSSDCHWVLEEGMGQTLSVLFNGGGVKWQNSASLSQVKGFESGLDYKSGKFLIFKFLVGSGFVGLVKMSKFCC